MIKGKRATDDATARVVYLLRTTECSFGEIATRMGCSKTFIAKVNRQFGIRPEGARPDVLRGYGCVDSTPMEAI